MNGKMVDKDAFESGLQNDRLSAAQLNDMFVNKQTDLVGRPIAPENAPPTNNGVKTKREQMWEERMAKRNGTKAPDAGNFIN